MIKHDDPKRKKSRGRPRIWSKIGRPSKLEEILALFSEDGPRIQAKELKQKALKQGISPNTLFPYLRRLEDNFQVMKEVDVPAKPPKVYYKRITEEEFFGKEAFLKIEAYLELMWPIAEKLPKMGVSLDSLKKSVLESWSCLFTKYLMIIGSKAREIKDANKRKEFIEITTRIHLLPKLLKLSSLMCFEPKDWRGVLGVVEENIQKSKESFMGEVKKIYLRPDVLPSSLSRVFSELLERGEELTGKEIEKLVKVIAESLNPKSEVKKKCR